MATKTVGKIDAEEGATVSRKKPAPLISRKMLLFMVAMVLANTGGNMYGPLLPLYLKELNASVIQVRMFFTLTAWADLLSIIPVWFKFKLPDKDKQIESTTETNTP